jgi:hypothetical protein
MGNCSRKDDAIDCSTRDAPIHPLDFDNGGRIGLAELLVARTRSMLYAGSDHFIGGACENPPFPLHKGIISSWHYVPVNCIG